MELVLLLLVVLLLLMLMRMRWTLTVVVVVVVVVVCLLLHCQPLPPPWIQRRSGMEKSLKERMSLFRTRPLNGGAV